MGDGDKTPVVAEFVEREEWDLYDEERRLTGEIGQRGEPLPPGRCHLVIHVCMFDEAGRMLIQRRQTCKHGWPGLWDVTVGGAARRGENSRQAARRELGEELGLDMDFSGIRPRMTLSFPRGFDDVFVVNASPALRELRLQAEEVMDARWATMDEIHALMDAGQFLPYAREFLDLMYQQRHRDDVLS